MGEGVGNGYIYGLLFELISWLSGKDYSKFA